MELFIFLIGAALGNYIARVFMKPKYAGVLKSVTIDGNEHPTLLLDLYESGEVISNCDYVTFKVEKIKM